MNGYSYWSGSDERYPDPRAYCPCDTLLVPIEEIYEDFDELCEALGYFHEQYGETYAEHRNETAMFGDSWPGAQLQLAEMSAAIRRAEAVVAGHPSAGAPVAPKKLEVVGDYPEDDDIPF